MPNAPPDTTTATATPGTPAWWAARGAVAPEERKRGRPARSFHEIIDAAVDLLDEVGASAFNMRLLAKRLDSGTATLYRHVVSKEELMIYVVDHLLGEIQLASEGPEQQPRNWRDAARSIALQFHRVLTDHPNALPVLVSQIPIGPNALARREQSIATFVRLGFPPQLAARAYTTIAQYVIGSAVVQPGSPGPEDAAALAAYYRTLDPDAYPLTVAAADTLTATSAEDGFRQGLELLLDGIDRAHRRQRAHGA